MITICLNRTLKRLNISRYELAKRTGIQYQIIDNYYKNKVKRYDSFVLERICSALNCNISDIIEFCGGFKDEPVKIVAGGPMMGTAITDLDHPILKNNNALLAFSKEDAKVFQETDCIRCGRCASAACIPRGSPPRL